MDQLEPLLRSLDLPLTTVTPQASRSLNPHGALNGDRGFSWYFQHSAGRPEPATFGDCLWQVEQFILDLLERRADAEPLFLLGYQQGAVLATTLAAILPEYLAGVAVISGYLPEISGCRFLPDNLAPPPVLFIQDPDSATTTLELTRRSAEALGRSGSTELIEVAGAQSNPLAAAHALRGWFAARLSDHPGGLPPATTIGSSSAR